MYHRLAVLLFMVGCALAAGRAYAQPPPHPTPPVTTPPVAAPPTTGQPASVPPVQAPPFQTPPVTTGQPATTPSGQNLPAAANGAGDQSSHASAASQAVLNCTSAGQQGRALAACIIDGLGLSDTAQAVLGCVNGDTTGADLAGCITGALDVGQTALAQSVLQCVSDFQESGDADTLRSCIAGAVGG